MATHHGKAIGFSGPVLSEDDPIHREFERAVGRLRVRQDFRLPRRFWKIVIVGDVESKLKSAGFVLDQEMLLRTGAPLKSRPLAFRRSIADIETLTGLDFVRHYPQRTIDMALGGRALWAGPVNSFGTDWPIAKRHTGRTPLFTRQQKEQIIDELEAPGRAQRTFRTAEGLSRSYCKQVSG